MATSADSDQTAPEKTVLGPMLRVNSESSDTEESHNSNTINIA